MNKVNMFSLSLETWQDDVGTKLIVLWNMNRWKYMGNLVRDSRHLNIFKSEKLHISSSIWPVENFSYVNFLLCVWLCCLMYCTSIYCLVSLFIHWGITSHVSTNSYSIPKKGNFQNFKGISALPSFQLILPSKSVKANLKGG